MSLQHLIDTDGLTTFGQGTIVPLKTAVGKLISDIAPTETSPAASAHAVGSYIMYGGELYKVTAAIAVGDTLSTSTNIEATTVTAELGQGGGTSSGIQINDVTNDKTYSAEFQLYQGKPRIVYEEVQ